MAGSKSRIGASTDAATDGVARVEIVTRGEVRREYTSEERAQVLTEAAMPGARVLLVAQRYGISPSLVYRWRREAAGRPARQARPRAPSFVALRIPQPCRRRLRPKIAVPNGSRWCCAMAAC
jgi:transposase